MTNEIEVPHIKTEGLASRPPMRRKMPPLNLKTNAANRPPDGPGNRFVPYPGRIFLDRFLAAHG